MIILGDNGINYYGNGRDKRLKKRLSLLPITLFLIRGNHDRRPDPESYTICQDDRVGGEVMFEPEYPNLLFALDGAVYTFAEKRCLVIGGAYSVDKYYRLKMTEMGLQNYFWFDDEQLSDDEKKSIEATLAENDWGIDCVLSHTCPAKYKPIETFLVGIDQTTVDDSMEKWLDAIEDKLSYSKWYCGHWHIDKIIDDARFMFQDILQFE